MAIKVTLCIITYNHELFIEDCINGALLQKVDYDYEILIVDDYSTDNTIEIISRYTDLHPGKIRFVRRERNFGMVQNWLFAIKESKGEYIAICEGDDYWIDKSKIKKQVDFLDANRDYSLCFHKVKILEKGGRIVDDFETSLPHKYELLDSMVEYGNYIHTPSILFRNIINEFPSEIQQSPVVDFFIYNLLGLKGKFGYINEEMAVYRNEVGIWSTESYKVRLLKTTLTFLLLSSFYKKSGFLRYSDTLLNRAEKTIFDLLVDFDFVDLSGIRVSSEINTLIDEIIISRLLSYRSSQIEQLSIKQIIRQLLLRLKKRLFD